MAPFSALFVTAKTPLIGKPMTSRQRLLRSGMSIACCIAAWSVVSYSGLAPAFFLPTPTSVGAAMLDLFEQEELLRHIFITLARVMLGTGITVLVAVPLGMLAGASRSFSAWLEPLAVIFYYIPPPAVVPLSILWFGIGEVEKFSILFYGVGIYVFIATTDIVAHTRRDHVDSARTLGASTLDIYRHVIVPSALPAIWDLLRTAMGIAWLFVLIAEFVSAQSGLGHVLIQSQRFVQTANVLAVMLIIGAIGYLTDIALRRGYARLFPWSLKAR